jgi:hypothetical protein
MTPEDLVERSIWTEVSLGYAREHGQCKLAWLLGAVKDEVEFEGALVALPPGEHLSPARGISRGRDARNDARSSESEDDARRRKRKEEELRDRLAAWKLSVRGSGVSGVETAA